MRFSPAFLDELRHRVSLVERISRRVRLTKAGREWKGLCPFHDEKTPSFHVNEDKGFYHCFGCGAHGDVIRFAVEQEGLTFPDAVRRLAEDAGMPIVEERPEDHAHREKRDAQYALMARVAAWFAQRLAAPEGAKARHYITQRGLSDDVVRAFTMGYAPPGNQMLAAFADVAPEQLLQLGLTGKDEERGTAYDRFRNRIIFPIRDARGRIVAFGGRILDDGQPKYLNSPETGIFEKGSLVYNFDKAAPVARRTGQIVMVEGYMDVIALAQHGIAQAVAPLGTAVTERQLKLLWRAAPEPILCFDGDQAGQRAATRAMERALPLLCAGQSLRFALLPANTDPDDLVRARGAAAFQDMLTNATTLVDYLWRTVVVDADITTPERRAAARHALSRHVATIQDADVRALYTAEFRQRFDRLFQAGKRANFAGKAHTKTHLPPPAVADFTTQWINAILVAFLEYPALCDELGEQLAMLDITDPRAARLREAILDSAINNPGLDKQGLENALIQYNCTRLADDLRRSNRIHCVFTRPNSHKETVQRDVAAVINILGEKRRVDQELALATTRMRGNGTTQDLDRQQRLLHARSRLDRDMILLARRLHDA